MAGKHAGLDPPAGSDQQPSQTTYSGMKHLGFDNIAVSPQKHHGQKIPSLLTRPLGHVGSSALSCGHISPHVSS